MARHENAQRPRECVDVETRGNSEQRRLVEAADVLGVAAREFVEPADDRCRRHNASGHPGEFRCGRCALKCLCESDDGAVDHHVTRTECEALGAQPGDELHRHDAVATELCEVVVESHLVGRQFQHVGHGVTHSPLHVCLRGTHLVLESRLRQRAAIDLAVRQGGQRVEDDNRRGNHVVGQHRAYGSTQGCRLHRGLHRSLLLACPVLLR